VAAAAAAAAASMTHVPDSGSSSEAAVVERMLRIEMALIGELRSYENMGTLLALESMWLSALRGFGTNVVRVASISGDDCCGVSARAIASRSLVDELPVPSEGVESPHPLSRLRARLRERCSGVLALLSVTSGSSVVACSKATMSEKLSRIASSRAVPSGDSLAGLAFRSSNSRTNGTSW